MKLRDGGIYRSEVLGIISVRALSESELDRLRDHDVELFREARFSGSMSNDNGHYRFTDDGRACLVSDGDTSGLALIEELEGFVSFTPGRHASLGGKIPLGDFKITFTDSGFIAEQVKNEYNTKTFAIVEVHPSDNGHISHTLHPEHQATKSILSSDC